MSNRKFVPSEVDRLINKGLSVKPKGAAEKGEPSTTQSQPGKPKEDPLKACVLDLLNQGGRSEEEATAWCKDFLAMGGKDSEPESIDGANVREAERIMLDARDSLKPSAQNI